MVAVLVSAVAVASAAAVAVVAVGVAVASCCCRVAPSRRFVPVLALFVSTKSNIQ